MLLPLLRAVAIPLSNSSCLLASMKKLTREEVVPGGVGGETAVCPHQAEESMVERPAGYPPVKLVRLAGVASHTPLR